MHKTLERQLQKIVGPTNSLPKEFEKFLVLVSESYDHFDEYRSMMERSMEINSKELLEKNKRLVEMLEQTASYTELEGTKRAMLNVLEDLEHSKAEIEEAKAKDEALNRVLISIGEAIVVCDTAGTIILANNAFEQMMGWKSDEVVGKKYFEVLIAENEQGQSIPDVKRVLTTVLSTGEKIQTNEYYYTKKDGTRFPVSLTIAPLIFNDKIIGAVGNFRDITKEKAIDQMKTEFMSLVAHQLKTPIAIMRGFVENMLAGVTGKLTDQQREYLLEIQTSSTRAYSLIHDLLNISRIERGMVIVNKADIPLKEIVDLSVHEYKGLIAEKGLTLSVEEICPNVIVEADKEKTIEAIKNIINNSVKFTDHGTISVRIDCDDAWGIVTVSDTGKGIDDEFMKQIFSKQKVFGGRPVAGVGAGLGLYIANEFIKAQGGEILVDSTPDKGSTFTFHLLLKTHAA